MIMFGRLLAEEVEVPVYLWIEKKRRKVGR